VKYLLIYSSAAQLRELSKLRPTLQSEFDSFGQALEAACYLLRNNERPWAITNRDGLVMGGRDIESECAASSIRVR
jgi:hypothetical protein